MEGKVDKGVYLVCFKISWLKCFSRLSRNILPSSHHIITDHNGGMCVKTALYLYSFVKYQSIKIIVIYSNGKNVHACPRKQHNNGMMVLLKVISKIMCHTNYVINVHCVPLSIFLVLIKPFSTLLANDENTKDHFDTYDAVNVL